MDERFYGIFVISGMFICMAINCVVVNTMIVYNNYYISDGTLALKTKQHQTVNNKINK